MKYLAFEMTEPLPQLNNPHALAVIKPWVDAGKVGSLLLSFLENQFRSGDLARLAIPGNFFDFTRYRPTIVMKDNNVGINIQNAVINYCQIPGSHDLLLLNLLEPHMMAEMYVDSVLEVLKSFKVTRYYFIGSMYDMVPHTRPLLVTGTASTPSLQQELTSNNVISSGYQGPTTILSLIGQKALELGIETCTLIVHLPGYLTMEDDCRGMKRLLEIIAPFYGFQVPADEIEKANQQEEQVKQLAEQIIDQEPQYLPMLQQLENSYDSRITKQKSGARLSPEVEKFLRGLNIRFNPD